MGRATWPVISAIAYLVFAIFALELTELADGIATVWPSSGVLVAAMLLTTPDRRGWFLAGGAASSFAANLIASASPFLSFGITIANMAEAIVATKLILDVAKNADSFYTPSAILRFGGASVLAALSSSTIAAIFIALNGGHVSIMSYVSWLSTVSLGIMVVVPLILNVAHELRSEAVKTPRWGRTLGALLLVGAVTAVVFGQTVLPLLFLPLFTIIIATYIGGPNGAAGGIMLIAIIGSAGTEMGRGPVHLMRDTSTIAAVLFFQFYLLANVLAALPLAALLNTAARDTETITRGKRWLEMSEHFARVGHWRLDLKRHTLFWSDEVFRIHGLTPGAPPSLKSGIDFYHPDDRAMVTHCLDTSVITKQPYEFEARLLRADGELRYVCSRGEIELGPDGKAVAIFGIFQDVTAAALSAMELANARLEAEERVGDAMRLALTDPLTGIANRRRIMDMLADEVEAAARLNRPLSVALLDIDHFKAINDKLGHAVGDVVIQRIARICSNAVRGSDLVGRIGGEEFVIVLPGADPVTAMMIAERVRVSIEMADWNFTGLGAVTASLGVSTSSSCADVDTFLAEADAALYRAKNDGRNRLHLAA